VKVLERKVGREGATKSKFKEEIAVERKATSSLPRMLAPSESIGKLLVRITGSG
jgi:hypothetical protein